MAEALVTITLGREMGNNTTEDDFLSWVLYVRDRIDEECGFAVDVDRKSCRDIQEDKFEGSDEYVETARQALADLWDKWCSEGKPAQAVPIREESRS